jgi:hypothetical protein
MTDVPIYVAVITAGAGIIGALVPQATTLIRDVRQAERDRRERYTTAGRAACVELLRAAGELRVLTETLGSYRGDANGMRARVAEVLGKAEATRLYAASVSLQAPGKLAAPAKQVAEAATNLANEVVRGTNLDHGVLVDNPDMSKLAGCIDGFRNEAVDYFKDLLGAELSCFWPASCSATSR